ncbi:hypothetical protein [Streptomyces sp.]|uniref:hypothetical protein n=1 Tax=Streptomyces sp. TaxID=1931 RepID=UPI002F91FFB0
MDVQGALQLLKAEPSLLPAAPGIVDGEDIERRRQSEAHTCLYCGQPATTALVAAIPEAGNRWLDLCWEHFALVRQYA